MYILNLSFKSDGKNFHNNSTDEWMLSIYTTEIFFYELPINDKLYIVVLLTLNF